MCLMLGTRVLYRSLCNDLICGAKEEIVFCSFRCMSVVGYSCASLYVVLSASRVEHWCK